MSGADIRQTLEGTIYGSQELRDAGFKSVGKDVRVHSKANIFGLENITLGNRVHIGPFTNISASAQLIIGSNVHIAGYCHVSAVHDVIFDDFSCLSQGVKLYTVSDDFGGDHMTNPTLPDKYLGAREGPVRIGRHSLVGAGSIILPHITIEDGVSVGSLSLISKTLLSWGVYGGVPAKFIKPRSKKLLDLEAAYIAECEQR